VPVRKVDQDSDASCASPGRLGSPRFAVSVTLPDKAVVDVFATAVSSCAVVRGANCGVADAPDDSSAAPTATAPTTTTGTSHRTPRPHHATIMLEKPEPIMTDNARATFGFDAAARLRLQPLIAVWSPATR
jgi:hypothetical protein